ncbi:HNH endonuclease [Acinetobacter baumannii]|uniref:HNH endonuclease n=1 Tax=Acinetobacter baumannii TaxID=470 RepID=UPI002958ADE2|nr:HNH endonuclease [Acinetobacter baumannii]WNX72481.1 HNH endonuclease [Acinetobacter baumannii]
MPINSCFAGKTMMSKDLPAPVRGNYPNGVPFNMKGFPNFSRYAKTTVNIGSFTKDRVDFRSANAKIGLSGSQAPDGFVWHHTDKNGVLQLIPRDIHDAVRHTGGAAICGISNRGLYGI